MAVLGRPTTSARRPYFFFLEPEVKKTLRFRRRSGRRWRRSASAINALADVGHLPWLKEYEGRAPLSKPGFTSDFLRHPWTNRLCRGRDSNLYAAFATADFKMTCSWCTTV